MALLKRWRKKRKLRDIPLEFSYNHLYKTLKSFNEDIPISTSIPKKEELKKKSISKKQIAIERVIYRTNFEILHDAKSHIGMYDATYKVVLFGDSNTGKATLTQKFLTNLFKSDTKMTVGVDFEVKSLEINGKKVKLQIWDFGGEERFRFLLPTYVRGANGALFIYNAANYNSLVHIDDWLLIIRKEIKSEEDTFPIIVVGILPEFEEERQVSAEQGINIARSIGVDGFIECSPKTGENVEETFDALTRLMLAKSNLLNQILI